MMEYRIEKLTTFERDGKVDVIFTVTAEGILISQHDTFWKARESIMDKLPLNMKESVFVGNIDNTGRTYLKQKIMTFNWGPSSEKF